MMDLSGKTAVITGASSGIGFAFAQSCAERKVNVVLASRNVQALEKAQLRLSGLGGEICIVPTDVTDPEAVEALADRAYDQFGAVHMVINNAGIAVATDFSTFWMPSLEDWHKTINVNVWGVIHGCRTFVKRMLSAGTEGYIVNVASGAGLRAGGQTPMYDMSKNAVVCLSESLSYHLNEQEAPIRVSVLCPGVVQSEIADRMISVAPEMENPYQERVEKIHKAVAEGMNTKVYADRALDAVLAGKLYVVTHEGTRQNAVRRLERILADCDQDKSLQ